MSTVLVVDDSALDRTFAGSLLAQEPGLSPVYAADGQEALSVIERARPDVVLTDLQMPVMDGLQVVEAIRGRYPSVPVILMTAHGSEEIAVKALRRGAASYVPKRQLARDLVATVRDVLAAAQGGRRHHELLECVKYSESSLVLDNTPTRIPDLVAYLQDTTALMRLCDETGLIRLGIALTDALDNALFHGNLEIGSELPPGARSRGELALERRNQPPYRDRHIYVSARLWRSEAVFTIRDEGPGFEPAALPDPTDPANLEKVSGRGVLLMRTFMDEVIYNDAGNEVTLVKRREGVEGS